MSTYFTDETVLYSFIAVKHKKKVLIYCCSVTVETSEIYFEMKTFLNTHYMRNGTVFVSLLFISDFLLLSTIRGNKLHVTKKFYDIN